VPKGLLRWLWLFAMPLAAPTFAQIESVLDSEPEEGLTTTLFSDFTYDSNIFRFANSQQAEATLGESEMADSILHMGAGLEYRRPVSKQLFSAKVEAVRNEYNHFDFLSYTGGNASVAWDWLFGQRWDGKLEATYERKIQDFAESRLTGLDVRDDVGLRAGGNYSFNRSWRIRVAGVYKEQNHSDSDREALDRSLTRAIAELRYTASTRSFIGLRSMVTTADFPNQQTLGNAAVDNSFQEMIHSLTVDWKLSALSALVGEFGHTNREYDSFSERDFSGATWHLDFNWQPRAQYDVTFSLWRDLEAYSDAITSYVVESGASVEGVWRMTSKIALSAEIASLTREFDGDPSLAVSSEPTREDDVISYGVSADYALRDSVIINLGFQFEERDSNTDTWDFDYYNIVLGIKASL